MFYCVPPVPLIVTLSYPLKSKQTSAKMILKNGTHKKQLQPKKQESNNLNTYRSLFRLNGYGMET